LGAGCLEVGKRLSAEVGGKLRRLLCFLGLLAALGAVDLLAGCADQPDRDVPPLVMPAAVDGQDKRVAVLDALQARLVDPLFRRRRRRLVALGGDVVDAG
jgi:hypothetical protein